MGKDPTSDHHDHDHTHRGGIAGWLQHTFAHSHDIHEKVDDVMESHERGLWATKIALLSLGLTTVFQAVVVWQSGSTALFADTVHNLGDGANSIPLLIAFALQRRMRSRRFTYGFGRSEDLAGIVIVLSIAVSAGVAGWESIKKMIEPEPVILLWWVAAAAIVGFLGNEIVAVIQMRTGKQIGSAALIADGQHARIDGFTSLAVLAAVIGGVVGVPILDPIIGLLITAAIVWILKDAAISIFQRLLDGIEPEILAQVEHAPMHVPGVRGVHEVRARWLGHRVHADLHVTVDSRLSVAESHRVVEQVQRALADHVSTFGGAIVHVCPASEEDEGRGLAPAVA
ncbi:MAG: cation diffusion facilitator family transporter [Thermomicrobiales bacterium]